MNVHVANQASIAQQLMLQRLEHFAAAPPLPQPPPATTPPKGDGTFAAEVSGTRPQPDTDLQLAMMANDAYSADNPLTEQALAEAGWTRLEPGPEGSASMVDGQGRVVDIDPALLSTSGGFDAAIYQNDQGQYVVAFRGTDTWPVGKGSDLDDNLGQGLGFETGQYRDAVALAEAAERAFGDGNVVFTGHSLGGGLASAAALATGNPGVTFNASGLSDQTLESLEFNPNAVREAAADSGQVRRYIVNGDPLNGAQQDLPIIPVLGLSPPNAVGHELRIDPPPGLGGLDLAGLHGGGGDGASYVEALRLNTAYDPALRPTLPERVGDALDAGLDRLGDVTGGLLGAGGNPLAGWAVDRLLDAGGDVAGGAVGTLGNAGRDGLERLGEYNLNQLGSVLRHGLDVAADVKDSGAGLLDGLREAGAEFMQGDLVDGTARALGDVLDFGIDSAGDLADGVLGLAGDTVQNLANVSGGLLRDLGDGTVLEAPLDAVAGFVEGTGKVASDAADGLGGFIDGAADAIGDRVEVASDVLGDIGQATADGVAWLGEKLDPRSWF